MGLRDFLRRGGPGGRPRAGDPGAVSTPESDGQGTATLADRMGAGAPASNQGRAEALPPTGDRTPAGGPGSQERSLGEMNAGAAGAQTARPPALAGPDVSATPAGSAGPNSLQDRLAPAAGPPHDAAPTGDPEAGAAMRTPGSMGSMPAGEQIESDLARASDNMTDVALGNETGGDSHSVSTSGEDAALGTSEQAQPVQGVRLPVDGDTPL